MSAAAAELDEVGTKLAGPAMRAALNQSGSSIVPKLLSPRLCTELRDMYGCERLFRSRVVMARHHYGSGEYQYFAEPPPLVMQLRRALYAELAPIANDWHARLGRSERFPSQLEAFTQRCHDAGQCRPTPLLLRYTQNDYNCLHQDLYGSHVFPLQVAILLSQPGHDFAGGEFVLTEQRPRRQSRVEVICLQQGIRSQRAPHRGGARPSASKATSRCEHGPTRGALHAGSDLSRRSMSRDSLCRVAPCAVVRGLR